MKFLRRNHEPAADPPISTGRRAAARMSKRQRAAEASQPVASQAKGQPHRMVSGRPEEAAVATLSPQAKAAAIAEAIALIMPTVHARIDPVAAIRLPRRDVAIAIRDIIIEAQKAGRLPAGRVEIRELVTAMLGALLHGAPADAGQEPPQPQPVPVDAARLATPPRPEPEDREPEPEPSLRSLDAPYDFEAGQNQALAEGHATSASVEEAKDIVQPLLLERIDVTAAADLPRGELARQIAEIVSDIRDELRLRVNLSEQRDLVTILINDMLGLGPLEPLQADDSVTDILVNGAQQVFVERKGKLALSDVQFRDDAHVMNIAQRIVNAIGRRVDESSPICDARLADGSRVNIIIPPLALDGPSISIRKFSKKSITLDLMSTQKNISSAMATVMKVAARSRLNILISGGTGSGKTTLLNAMSQLIDNGERIVTIEDSAELQLQQPHVVRLETRPANLEGHGEITMRDLLKNALRMRPDRIILGEVRSSEAVDMLQAMNTGHDGSMCTVHANRPREALTRLENMIGMAGINLPSKAVRTQIAAAIDIIVQVSRMRDGMRRITSITEIVGMEDDVITTQELFTFKFEGEEASGLLKGRFDSSGLRRNFTPKAEYFGLDRTLLEAI